jgi:hypothetical protein
MAGCEFIASEGECGNLLDGLLAGGRLPKKKKHGSRETTNRRADEQAIWQENWHSDDYPTELYGLVARQL